MTAALKKHEQNVQAKLCILANQIDTESLYVASKYKKGEKPRITQQTLRAKCWKIITSLDLWSLLLIRSHILRHSPRNVLGHYTPVK